MAKKKTTKKSTSPINWITANSTLIETIPIGMILIGIILKYIHINFSNPLLITGFICLAIAYYFLGYSEHKNPNLGAIAKMVLIARGSSTAVCLLGILFSLQTWNGSHNLLLVGAISLGIVYSAMMYFRFYLLELEDFSIEVMIKSGVILTLTIAKLTM